jgi:hypothetical protein
MLSNHIKKRFKEDLFTVSDDILIEVLDFIRQHSNEITPDEVFDDSDLMDWAENHGYILKKDSQDD